MQTKYFERLFLHQEKKNILMYSNKAKENHPHHSNSSSHHQHRHHHHHHNNQLIAPSLERASSSSFSHSVDSSTSSSSKHQHHPHQSSLGDPSPHQQQPAIIREKGVHHSRTTTIMPHRAVVTGGSLSPVSHGTATSSSSGGGGGGWYNMSGSFRRDSGGSACSDKDRRGSGGSSADRRDSGGSSYSSSNGRRVRKDSEESATNAATTRIMEDHLARDRRDSGGSDKSEDGTGTKKKGIFRQLMKWSSPGHHFKSKKDKVGKNEAAKGGKSKGEEDEEAPTRCKFTMSSEKFNQDGRRESSLSPVATSPRKGTHSRASTLTDVTNSRSDSDDCHSCSSCSSVSGSESGSDNEIGLVGGGNGVKVVGENKNKQEDHFDVKERYPFRPNYYAYYHDLPRRVRSQSVDFVYARKELRRRRFSENHEWIRGDNKKDSQQKDRMLQHEKVPEEENWAPKTIYQAILHEMGRRGSLHSHRPADALIDPAHAAILFRDSRGLPVADPFLERILTLSEEDQTEILVKFFKFHKCYDLIPTSAKLVVFDTQLLVKKAFFALVYNGVRAAPLWDSSVRQFVGMLTITDFIRVLHAMYHDSAGRMSELEEHRIETWRRRFLQDKQPLIFIDPDASLFDAICSLVNNRIHRLPIIDQQTGNVLHILTHKRILKFLFLYIHEIPRPTFLNQKLGDVRIGTFDDVETAREDTSIIQALTKFLERRVSALPIVDGENRLLDIYARFDVINLAAEKTYNNLDITLKQANEHRNEWFEGVHKCTLEETLFVIMERIVKAEVHRLVVVDEQDKVVGVLSLSDILQYVVMRPEVKDILAPDLKELMRSESPRPDLTPSPGPTSEDTTAAEEIFSTTPPLDEEETNEANNNSLSPTDLNGSRDNPTIIEEEDEKL